MIKIVAISNTYLQHEAIDLSEGGDILIHCGNAIKNKQSIYELQEFIRWFSVQKFKNKIFVPTEHDMKTNMDGVVMGVHIMCNSHSYVSGLKIASYCHSGDVDTDIGVLQTMTGVDLMISNVPPHGVLDEPYPDAGHVGDETVGNFVKNMIKPRLCIFSTPNTNGFRMDDNGTQYYNVNMARFNYKNQMYLYFAHTTIYV